MYMGSLNASYLLETLGNRSGSESYNITRTVNIAPVRSDHCASLIALQ